MPTTWLRLGRFWRVRKPSAEGRGQPRVSAKPSGTGETESSTPPVRWTLLMALGLLALHLFLFPPLPRNTSDFPVAGDIARDEIRAPFAFAAPILEQEVERMRYERALNEPPVLLVDSRAEESSRVRFLTFRDAASALADSIQLPIVERRERLALQFPNQDRDYLRRLLAHRDPRMVLGGMETVLDELLRQGIANSLPGGSSYTHVLVVDGDTEERLPRETIVEQSRLSAELPNSLWNVGVPPSDTHWVASLLRPFIEPNRQYDSAETELRQKRARQSVPTTYPFDKGERIVAQSVKVTPQQAVYLETLNELLLKRGSAGDADQWFSSYANRILLLALALGLYSWLGWIYFPHMLARKRLLSALAACLALFLVGASFTLDQPGLGTFAVPVAMLALLTTVLFKDRVGYASALLVTGFMIVLPDVNGGQVVVWLANGLVTVTAVRRIQKRSQFYQTAGLLTLLSVFLITTIRTAAGASLSDIGSEYLVGLLTPILSVAFPLFLLPIIEPWVGVTSDLTLLELSDLNHPLLQRMSIEAPGTFHHSQVVGQLAESAARSIDANALLVRVGALFHDIGKMQKSEYYVENQRSTGGKNKHDELSPSMSALIIASHVKDGIDLARQWKLPSNVIDFIPEHHGTQVMEYFYHKALEAETNETVKVDDFRYPGPKPQSRETAILMLADAVEAATRSLAKPTPSRIKEITKQIVDKRMLSGELDESNLTLQDLARIRSAFIPLLTGIHHARIAYPGQKESDRIAERKSELGTERKAERSAERSSEARTERKTRA